VLVDGLRYVNGSAAGGIPASVDLNALPTSLIERVEVLQSGASPLYGTDAVAGVVNIITKQRPSRACAPRRNMAPIARATATPRITRRATGSSRPTPAPRWCSAASYAKQVGVRTADRSISQFPNAGQ
jgi:iron complex outermembrane receptor protein